MLFRGFTPSCGVLSSFMLFFMQQKLLTHFYTFSVLYYELLTLLVSLSPAPAQAQPSGQAMVAIIFAYSFLFFFFY
jgi:hypothetical protein